MLVAKACLLLLLACRDRLLVTTYWEWYHLIAATARLLLAFVCFYHMLASTLAGYYVLLGIPHFSCYQVFANTAYLLVPFVSSYHLLVPATSLQLPILKTTTCSQVSAY